MTFRLTIANKAYSSWSMRPWLLLAHFKIGFEEIVIALDQSDTREKILAVSPTGKLPALQEGAIRISDSLAILEYVAEAYPHKPIWPRGKTARAHARMLANEMHAGFMAMRRECPMNFRRAPRAPVRALSDEALADFARIEAAFSIARARFGRAGPFLFGKFCATDAMFAPVVNRLHVYGVPVRSETRAYMDAMMALPAWIAWTKDAQAEAWVIEKYEAI